MEHGKEEEVILDGARIPISNIANPFSLKIRNGKPKFNVFMNKNYNKKANVKDLQSKMT